MKSIPYSRQHIDAADIVAVTRVLRSDWLTQGANVDAFEQNLCRYSGAAHAAAVSSGTAALHVACLAAGFREGDEVIVPANTFAATANAVVYVGAKPIFADIDPSTGNIDTSALSALITKRTKGIIGVDFAGVPCEWKKIAAIARKHRLIVIDDASHALGAKIKEGSSWLHIGGGKYADMTTFSFHPLKSITTGEGGAVLTNSSDLAKRLRRARSHGIDKDYEGIVKPMVELGYNYRITDIQCALGNSQLRRLTQFIAQRQKIDATYRRLFKGNAFFSLLSLPTGIRSSYHLFPILLRDAGKKDLIIAQLRRQGIGVQTHYMPVYWHPFYQQLGYKRTVAPVAEDFHQREISLPIFPGLTVTQQKHISRVLIDICQDAK